MGTDWAEILGGCQSRETEQLLPWSFLKFTNKKVVILQFCFVLSARPRARALGQASQSWGAWPPARSKKTSKTSSYARARWNLANFKLWFSSNFVCSWGTPCLCAVPYGRACSLRSAHFHWNMRVLERKSWSNLFCSSRPPCLWAGPYGRSCSVRYVDFHWKISVFKG